MIKDKTKVLCLIAFALTASGCSNDGTDITDTQLLDDAINADVITTTEVTNGTGTSSGIATQVTPVSSAQMAAFVRNPLLAAIPTELNGGTSTSLPRSYITNPLTN